MTTKNSLYSKKVFVHRYPGSKYHRELINGSVMIESITLSWSVSLFYIIVIKQQGEAWIPPGLGIYT